MGAISKGILGPFSGTVGTVIGGSWKGISYMRSQPTPKKNRVPSPKQLDQQARFATVVEFLRPMTQLVAVGFKTPLQMTGFNSAVSFTLKNAVTGSYPAYSIAYDAVLVSRGDLPNATAPTAQAMNTSLIAWDWTNNSGVGSAAAAIAANGTVKINWNIETEINTQQYSIERSANAAQFSSIGILKATGSSKYSWIDNAPVAGNGFYRIKAIDQNGAITYSSIVKISVGNKLREIVVAPNPIRGRTISLQLNNLDKGNYTFNILNNVCQNVFNGYVTHAGGNSIQTIWLPASVTKGTYYIEVSRNTAKFNKIIIVE